MLPLCARSPASAMTAHPAPRAGRRRPVPVTVMSAGACPPGSPQPFAACSLSLSCWRRSLARAWLSTLTCTSLSRILMKNAVSSGLATHRMEQMDRAALSLPLLVNRSPTCSVPRCAHARTHAPAVLVSQLSPNGARLWHHMVMWAV
jgi:hypothetical protein